MRQNHCWLLSCITRGQASLQVNMSCVSVSHLFQRSTCSPAGKLPAGGRIEDLFLVDGSKQHCLENYCGWKKTGITLDGWNSWNNEINHVSTGAGFLPSTLVGEFVKIRCCLVDWTHLKKYESVGMMTFPTEWKKKKHVPNHEAGCN